MSNSTTHVPSLTQRDGYSIYQAGQHASGTFIRVYIPDSAIQVGKPLRSITYLHGFALCMPSFYEKHLEELVSKGYIVFFPDFQRSCYPNTLPDDEIPSAPQEFDHLRHWYSVATMSNDDSDRLLSAQETPVLPEHGQVTDGLGPGFLSPSVSAARRTSLALVIIIALLSVLSWFRKEYGKHLIHLLSTVGISLFHKPTESVNNTIHLTQQTWDDLCDRYPHWKNSPVESFAFGHSLGGLIALSLPFGYQNKTDQRFYPQKIVVADPAASTEMGIPWFAIAFLKLWHSPFTESPITVLDTGCRVDVPTTILHGGADKLVKPKTWRNHQGESSPNFEAIATAEKSVYFSYSNTEKSPTLLAFHNQAVTSTQYYSDGLFENFGGVKNGPNDYDFQYVWPGLHWIFTNEATPKNLGSYFSRISFDVKSIPPVPSKISWAWIIGLSVLGSGVFSLWKWVG